MQRISVVIPVFCNSASVVELHRRLSVVLTECADDYEIVLVDDGSNDSSWELLSDIAEVDQRVKAIRLSRNFGQHAALCAGFQHCTGDVIVMMDADLEDHPEEMPQMIESLSSDADVVYTIKSGDRKRLLTEVTSRVYHAVFSRLSGTHVPRDLGTMRAFNRKVLESILQHGERSVLYGPLMMTLGFQQAFVEVQHEARPGSSSYSFRKRLNLAVKSLMTYTDLPVRLLTRTGSLLACAAVLYLLAVVAQYFIAGRQVSDGVTIVIVLLCMMTGVTMFSLGIIGGYVFQIYQEVLARPRYLIAESCNLVQTRADNPVPAATESDSHVRLLAENGSLNRHERAIEHEATSN